MNYITSDTASFYIALTSNIIYALLFIYHLVKKDANKSLMILSGSLCTLMVISHLFFSYKASLSHEGVEYYNIATHYYLVLMVLNSSLAIAIFSLHKIFKVPMNYICHYIFRCIFVSILLNFAMDINVVKMGNREPFWLWSLYSYAENITNIIMFLSVIIARKWSEVFRWLQLAHTR